MSVSIEKQIERWMELVSQGAPFEEVAGIKRELEEAMRERPFEMKQNLPMFLKFAEKLDAKIPFQHFRIPGLDRMIMDRREAPKGEPKEPSKDEVASEAAREAVKDEAREAKGKEGRDVREKVPDRGREAGRAGFAERGFAGGRLDALGERVERLLTAFEKMVVERFENGRQIAKESEDGKTRLLPKSDGDWKSFFNSFLDRVAARRTALTDVRDFLMRGLVMKGERGVFIGDINFTGGRVDKFARFSVLSDMLAQLRNLKPGETIGKELLKGLTSEELLYLALTASKGEEFAWSKAPEKGKFIGGKVEEQAAEALGFQLGEHAKAKAKKMKDRKGGLMGSLFGDEGPPEDVPYQFVPWWQWGNLSRPGRRKWTALVFYLALLAVALIGLGALTVKLLGWM